MASFKLSLLNISPVITGVSHARRTEMRPKTRGAAARSQRCPYYASAFTLAD